MIQTILILKRSGENICNKSIGKANWDPTLTSGFISAMFNFSEKTFDVAIRDIELGPFRILFEMSDDIIIVAVYQKHDSIINIQEKLVKLKESILSKYSIVLKQNICNLEEFQDLEPMLEKFLIESTTLDINEDLKKKLVKVLEDVRAANPEILDCDIISNKGIPLLKEWKKDFLDLCLRQMDAFWKSTSFGLDQIIITYGQRQLLLYKINENFVLSALVRRATPIGYATMLVEETAIKLAKVSKENYGPIF